MSDFTDLIDLASERLGGAAIAANDEFFASRENLVKPARPLLREGEYTDRGKWMDGWETRRRREPGHDWCVIRLGLAGVIRGFVVDTTHFLGNFPESCSIDAGAVEGELDLEALDSGAIAWKEILPRSTLSGNCENRFPVASDARATHVRLHIYPDGGVARLRVHGEVLPDWGRIAREGGEIDLAAVENGGAVVAASDMFFGSRHNLILPGRGRNMSDGWETRRRRGPGHDWAILRLGAAGTVQRVVVDNSLQGQRPGSLLGRPSLRSRVRGSPPLGAFECVGGAVSPHEAPAARAAQLREGALHAWPGDACALEYLSGWGRVSRSALRTACGKGSMSAKLEAWNTLSREDAAGVLLAFCGSRAWAWCVARARPIPDREVFLRAAEECWPGLAEVDWLEAFASHPRIGDPAVVGLPAREQSAVRAASAETLEALRHANREYQERFGRIFLVCAAGKSASEMLALCRQRLQNDPRMELAICAEEQKKITRLRLERWLTP